MTLSRDEEENSIALISSGKHVVFQVVSAKPLETSWSTDPPGTTYDLLQPNGIYTVVPSRCSYTTGPGAPRARDYRTPFYLLLEH